MTSMNSGIPPREGGAGHRIVGNYELLQEIGRGGMGIIYRARDLHLDRIVALKILREDLASQAQLVARFRREAQAAARLDHPNIAQIFSIGTIDGTPYIAMEFIDGTPLSGVMQQEGPMHWARALGIAEQVARALVCAHDAQVVHRDIKPPNILIDRQGSAYVTDFGIAKILTLQEQLTVDGARLGTPQYMSPERCRNEEVTAAGDIYSLGVLLFQMISGRLPFEASSSVQLVRKILSEQPARLREFEPNVPEGVERLVAYLIEKRPANRPVSAGKVLEAIALVREGKPLNEDQLRMTSALGEFRRSDTPRPAYVREDPTTQLLPDSVIARVSLRWFGTPHVSRVMAAVLSIVMLGTGIGFGLAYLLQEDPAVVAARMLDVDLSLWHRGSAVAERVPETPDVSLVEFNLPEMTLSGIRWGYDCVFVEFEGVARSPREGQRLVCSYRPDLPDYPARITFPVLGAGVAEGASLEVLACARTNTAAGFFTGKSVVRYLLWNQLTRAMDAWVVPCGPVAGQAPPAPLFYRALKQGRYEVTDIGPRRIVAMDVAPHGRGLALSYSRPTDQACCIIEMLPEREGSWHQRTLTTFGLPVTSVRYSPDGNQIAYLRETAGGISCELWVVDTMGHEPNGILLRAGVLSLSSAPFSPDGDRIVLSADPGFGQPDLVCVSVLGEEVYPDLGKGTTPVCCPLGPYLVTTDRDRLGNQQLFAVEMKPPHRRAQLTHLDGGIVPPCDVAGNGRWAAVGLPAGEKPTLVLVDLSGLRF